MNNTTLKVKNRTQVRTATGTASSVVAGQALGTVGVASGLIGLWAVACMVGAVVTQGPLALVTGWFSAMGVM